MRSIKFFIFFLIIHAEVFCDISKETHYRYIQKALEVEQIVSQIPMRDFLLSRGQIAHFSSQVYLVKLESGLKAVLKIDDSDWPRAAVAEVAAYRASCFLNLYLVPPTVFYHKNGVIGSLQYYVEPALDLMVKENYKKVMQEASSQDLANIQLFYFVMGQWDPDPSNLIVSVNDQKLDFALIDNAAIGFPQKVLYGDYPFVLMFPEVVFPQAEEGPFLFDNVRVLPPERQVWRQEFPDIFNEEQITSLCQLKRPIHFVIWQGRFWRQYRFGCPSKTDIYPTETMKSLNKLNDEIIREFFQSEFVSFSDEFYRDLLERRDQIVK